MVWPVAGARGKPGGGDSQGMNGMASFLHSLPRAVPEILGTEQGPGELELRRTVYEGKACY